MRAAAIWMALVVALAVPVALSLTSPLLQWRDPVYIMAAFAGALAMAAMVMQPLAIAGRLPLGARAARFMHRWMGAAIVCLVLLHVAGLWVTSPPDVIDALLFTSPAPFAPWGVLATAALLGSALLAILRLRGWVGWRNWRRAHLSLAALAVIGTVTHALLILGTMETISKWALAVILVVASAVALLQGRRV